MVDQPVFSRSSHHHRSTAAGQSCGNADKKWIIIIVLGEPRLMNDGGIFFLFGSININLLENLSSLGDNDIIEFQSCERESSS